MGIGKTWLIQHELLPLLQEYTVIDLCREYLTNIHVLQGAYGMSLREMKSYVVHELILNKDNKDNTWIIENPLTLSSDLSLLNSLIKDKNVIITFQSIGGYLKSKLSAKFDKIYVFPTHDNEDIRTDFLIKNSNISNIIIREGYNITEPYVITLNNYKYGMEEKI